MPNFVGAVPIPPVSAEFVRSLRAAFSPYAVEPGFDRDALMQSVGEQKVIEWIVHMAVQGKTVTGDPMAVRSTAVGAIVRLGE